MALSPGTRLGVYEVAAKIGEGGMGEVYQARDTKLDRDVALKVLPEAFTSDPDRLARFEREAKLLASLNHPNIAAIHGLEDADDTRALVLELVEGWTLADWIARGPIPVDEALQIAKQIAEALEAAHEAGVIHRDLKPSNIKVRDDGTVKVLDFGLAKALESESAAVDLSQSPTVTATTSGTREGLILGTAPYMSPEQARGKPLDRRTDIWSFGCVLFEMLTGQAAFAGATLSDTIANVLDRQPQWSELPAGTPQPLRRVLRRCLEKDRKRRLDSAAAGRFDIEEALTPLSDESSGTAARPSSQRTRSGALTLAASVAITMAVTALAVWGLLLPQSESPGAVVRLEMPVAGETGLQAALGSRVAALSPDGARVAFAAEGRLYVRALDAQEATPLPGTEGGQGPFFSPDGQWVAFWSRGRLRKVAITGGPPVEVGRASNHFGASWEADGTILLGQRTFGIERVSADSGAREPLIQVAEGDLAADPQRLPDGEWVLFTLRPTGAAEQEAQVVAESVVTGEREVLVTGGRDGRYLPTGHLAYTVDGVLFAVPFDADTRTILGDPLPVVDNIAVTGDAHFSIADNGTLLYVPGSSVGRQSLVWVDRSGEPVASVIENEQIFGYPRLSPDGTQVALNKGSTRDVWVLDLERGTETRLTEGGSNLYPIWDARGTDVTYMASSRTVTFALFHRPADRSAPAQLRLDMPGTVSPGSWAPDNSALVVTVTDETGDRDLWLVPEGGAPEPFLDTPFMEATPRGSPDGRWVAYHSDQSGEQRIYVRPFTGGDQVIPVSAGRGGEVVWARDGRELFYRDGRRMMSVAVTPGEALTVSAPRLLFERPFAADLIGPDRNPMYDVSLDGQRFLMVTEDATADTMTVVLNWFEELKARVRVP
jgi:serine/threonine-protein kinase